MRAVELVVIGLAVWRVSSLLTSEHGPFHIFSRLRERFGIVHNGNGRPAQWPDNFWGELLTCVWCISPYVGLFASVLYYLSGSVIVWLCLPFALSAVAILVNKQVR